jgi:hypothetical protein
VPKAHPIWTKEWISTATLNVANGYHGNTLTEVWFALYFHRQRNIKFSFRRHILYNKINLLVVPSARQLRKKIQKSSCLRHENSIVGMNPMATHCRKLIVTGIYQANSYQKFVMSYWLAFVPKVLNMLSILKCNNYVLAIGLFSGLSVKQNFSAW